MKYNYMSKIFPKIYVKFDLKFHCPEFYYYVVIKQMNSNKY